MYYRAQYSSPIGNITITCDGENICGLWLEGQKYFYGTLKKEVAENDNIHVLKTAKKWLEIISLERDTTNIEFYSFYPYN